MTTQLPPQGPPEPDENLPGEAELAALYRQLPQSEPSPALDAAVLRAAAQALAPDEASPVLGEHRKAEHERGDWARPKSNASSPAASSSAGGSRRRPRWPIALSSAATLVLAAGLAWHMRELPPTTSTPTALDSSAPAQAAATASLPHATSSAAAIQPAEPASPPPMEPPKQPPPKMMVAPWRTPTANALRKAIADQSAERASSKAQVTSGVSQYAPTPMAAPAAAPPVAPQETSSNSVEAAREMPATMAAAPAPPAPPADEPLVPQVAGDSAANAAAKPTLDEAAPVAATADIDTTLNTSDTPAQELGKIRQLFALGHDDEARQRLTAFHLTHPRWDLPLDLQAQLRKP